MIFVIFVIMSGMLIFGVPNIFNFTFRAGSQLTGLSSGTIDDESSLSNNMHSKSSKELGAIASSPSHGAGKPSPSPCGTLSNLPREVRNMIYTEVMKYRMNISRPHRFLGRQPSILAKECKYLQGIDAALLRTCKAIYHEAVDILYGKNKFYFSKPSDIEDFAHLGLGNMPFGFYGAISKCASAVNTAPWGRLTMIRRLSLKLGSENNGDDLQKVWSLWSDFLYPAEKQDQLLEFPALDWLALDLTDWKLNAKDASKVRVCPYRSHYLPLASAAPVSQRSVSPVSFGWLKMPPSRHHA